MFKSKSLRLKLSRFIVGVTATFMMSGVALADPYVKGYEAYNDGNFDRAIAIWTHAAEAGQYGPMTALQGLYEEGVEGWDDIADFPPDPVKASYWRQKAEARYVVEKQLEETYFRAVKAKQAGDFVSAARDLQTAANGGNDHAMTLLAIMYSYGEGVEQSDVNAVYWARKAYDLGNIFVGAQLGYYYTEGLGVDQSYTKGLEYLRYGEASGEATALFYLGYMYANGNGVSTNYDKAMDYFKRAKDGGVPEAVEAYADFKIHVADYKRRQAEVRAYNRGVDEYNARIKRENAAKRAEQARQRASSSQGYQYKSWTTNYNVPSTPFGSSANAQRNWARYNCNLSGGRVGC